jgi:hypothetical protein
MYTPITDSYREVLMPDATYDKVIITCSLLREYLLE